MAVLIALAVIGVFAAGAFAGIIGMVSVAIHGEERSLTLTSEATGNVIQVGRWINGVYIRAPRRTPLTARRRLPSPPAGQPGSAEPAHQEA